MKKEIRILGIDDAPFDKFKNRDVLVIGTVYRGGSFMDGVISTKVRVDGRNSTQKLIRLVSSTHFRPMLKCILLNGIALAGFNVIDINKLSENTNLPVIVVIRKMPNLKKIKTALIKIKQKNKIKLIEKAGAIHKIGKIYCQLANISLEKAKQIINISSTHSHIPEPIRIAHLIAAGVVKGESSGDA